MFEDRREAGEQLARRLEAYRDRDVVVLAIPRGGVEVGYQVATHLNADFSLLIARKLPYPDQPEAGFGAVAEDGSTVILGDAARWVSDDTIETVVEEQRREIERRVAVLRRGEPLPNLEGRTVILVDDGIAMGSTMRAAIKCCRSQGASTLVVAVPVSGREVAEQIGALLDGPGDEIVVLEQPRYFCAVAQVYERWYDVPDSEVTAIMDRWRREHAEEA
ncbi:MAG: phosphoribosyltransferase family protein [Chloroflexota bacterium]|nr:phosphoribosyltransferase family protein [Chloroflexota bacterium]